MSNYRIVIGEQCSPSERHAAFELQSFLEEISGVRIAVASDSEPMGSHEILVGRSSHLENLGQDIDWSSLGEEGFVLRTVGNHLVVAGAQKRGTLYGVYCFLEDILGCRWFAPDQSRIPKQDRLEIPEIDRTHVPVLEYRAVGWPPSNDADWAARNRVNAGAAASDKARGGQVAVLAGGHSFYSFVPPEKYFETHPEYFSEVNGRRTYQKAQLCLTNEEVVELVAQKVKETLRANPEANLIGVGQGDWGGWCECKNCRAIDEAQESHSGSLIHFLNRVGEKIEPEFPEAAIVSLAYQFTRKPPKDLAPRRNVIPWLCGIECCYSHTLESCEINASFLKDLEGWAGLTNRFYIWDYTANFEHYIMPQPNLRVFQPNIQLFVKNHVHGIYASGNTGNGSELGELRGYLLAKLLWNPDIDLEKTLTEFLEGYYGKAAPEIRRYLDLMHDKVEKENIHCMIASGPQLPHLSPEMIARAREIFDEAEQAAENEIIRERVRLARMPIQHVQLEWSKPGYRVVDGYFRADLIPGAEDLARNFAEVGERHQVPLICEFEHRGPSWHLKQQEFWKKKWPAVRLENEVLRVDVVPGLGGRIVSLWEKASGRELLLPAQSDGREYPWSGGYEEYSQREGRTDGWHEEYEFEVERENQCVRLWADLPNGLQMEKTFDLSPDSNRLTIRSGLMNPSGSEIPACLRVHPIFQLGPTEQVSMEFTALDGEVRAIPLTTEAGKPREHLLLEGKHRPNGVWVARNPILGLEIHQAFDPEEVEEALLDWLPSRGRFYCELLTPEKLLQQGERIDLTVEYRVAKMKG